VSKIAATTLMAMHAYDADTLKLDQPLKYFMKDLDSNFISIRNITPQQLMTHTAGLPSGIDINAYRRAIYQPDSIRSKIYRNLPDTLFSVRIAKDLYLNYHYRDSLWNRVKRIGLGASGNYLYSDLSMYIMKELLERILSTRIERYVDSAFYRPMGLHRIGYSPLGRFEREEIVPTENDPTWRKQVLQGDVHDPTVAFLGGIGGPAGIFSNASELGTVMQMLMNGGSYGGIQFFSPQTVALFTNRQPNCGRGLGFDMKWYNPTEGKGNCCVSASSNTFGHFGFTGTCAWADPQNKVVYVFLSNRVHPSASNTKINAYRIRQKLQQFIYDGLGLGLAPLNGFMADEYSCYYED
jgi:CubicO group peptidase (beta-lactamase class C family)